MPSSSGRYSSSARALIGGTAATLLLVFFVANAPACRAFGSPSGRSRSPAATCTSRTRTAPSTSLFMNKKGTNKKKARAAPAGFAGALRDLKMVKFPYAGDIRPGQQTPQRVVSAETRGGPDQASLKIMRPDYADSGTPSRASKPLLPWIVQVKTADEVVKMRASGKLAREILDLAGRTVKPGVTTDEIDRVVHEAIIAAGAYPSPLNYHGFPKSCCTSVNEVICHGIPDDRVLQEGDVINCDITVYLDGFHGDCSEMFVAGEPDMAAKKLLQTTYDCWIKACLFVKPGNDYKDIGAIIEDEIVPKGFGTVRNFCGHGIGQTFHTNPNILHYRNNEPNGQMAVGHTFTIEPMICEGSAKALTWPDEWTATTVDGGRSAQFEHTLLVTPDGVEALTGKNENSPLQFWERESAVHKGIWLGTSAAATKRQDEINALLLKSA